MGQRSNEDGRRLMAGAPEAVTVQGTYVIGLGWNVTIAVRRQFQGWAEARRDRYEGLVTEECVQVIEAALSSEMLASG